MHHIVFYMKYNGWNAAVCKEREIKIFICMLPLSNLTPLQKKTPKHAVVLSYSMDSLVVYHFNRQTYVPLLDSLTMRESH